MDRSHLNNSEYLRITVRVRSLYTQRSTVFQWGLWWCKQLAMSGGDFVPISYPKSSLNGPQPTLPCWLPSMNPVMEISSGTLSSVLQHLGEVYLFWVGNTSNLLLVYIDAKNGSLKFYSTFPTTDAFSCRKAWETCIIIPKLKKKSIHVLISSFLPDSLPHWPTYLTYVLTLKGASDNRLLYREIWE